VSNQTDKPDAAALVTRMMDAFDELARTPEGFEEIRDAMAEGGSFEEVAERIGGELAEIQRTLIDPEVEMDYTALEATTMDAGPMPVFKGHEGWIEMWRLWWEPWDWYEWADRTVEALDEHHAMLNATARCRGRTSGVTVEIPQHGYWTVRDGKLVRYRAFDTREKTVAAFEAEMAGAGRD